MGSLLHESVDCTGGPGPCLAFLEAMFEQFPMRPTQEEQLKRETADFSTPSPPCGKRGCAHEDTAEKKKPRGEFKRVSLETGAGKGQRVTKEVWVALEDEE